MKSSKPEVADYDGASFLLILPHSRRGGTDTCLPCVCSSTGKKKKKKKKIQVEHLTLGTANLALRRQTLISRRQLAPVHRQRSGSTLDSLIQLCDLHVCDMHQTLWLLPISMNVSVHVRC